MIDKNKDVEILNRIGIFQGLKQMGTLVLLQNVVYLLNLAISFILLLLLLVMLKGFFFFSLHLKHRKKG